MTDIARLVLAVDSTQTDKATKSLTNLETASKKVDKTVSNTWATTNAFTAAEDAAADKAWALANGYEEVGNQLVKVSKATETAAISSGQLKNATRQLPAQFTDIFTSLAGGQSPMMVLIQQGGQLKDSFGGAGTAAKAMGGYVMGLINPITLAAGAVAAGAYAWYNWGESAKEASAKASKAAKDAEKDANAAWAGVSISLEAQIADLQGKMQGAWGQLDAAKAKRAGITRETDAEVAQSIGAEVQARRKEIEGYQSQIDALQIQLSQAQEKEKTAREKKIEDQNKIIDANAKELAHANAMTRIVDIEISSNVQLTASQKKLVELLSEQEQGEIKLTDAEFARQSANLATMATAELAMQEYIKRQKEAEKAASEAAKKSNKAWETFADNTQRTMSDIFYKGLTGQFQNIEQAFMDMLKRMLANAAAARLSESLFGTGGTSGNTGWIGALLGAMSFEGGGFTGQGTRTGGVDGRGGFPAIVHPNETVVDNAQGQRAGGGGITLVDNTVINIDSRADRQQVMSDVTRLIEGKQAQLVDRLQRQGQLA